MPTSRFKGFTLKFLLTRIWLFGIWASPVGGIFLLIFFHFLRGHHQLSISTLHVIFEKIIRLW